MFLLGTQADYLLYTLFILFHSTHGCYASDYPMARAVSDTLALFCCTKLMVYCINDREGKGEGKESMDTGLTDKALHSSEDPFSVHCVPYLAEQVLVPYKACTRRPRSVATLGLSAVLPEAVRPHVMLQGMRYVV